LGDEGPSSGGTKLSSTFITDKNAVSGIFWQSYPIGTINLNVTMGDSKRIQTTTMKFAVVKSHSPYNVILGRTGLRSLGAMASTIHSMIKFPIANGIATMIMKRETLHECQRMEEAQGPAMERRTTLPQIQALGSIRTTSQGKKKDRWHTDKAGEPDDTLQLPPNPPKKDTQTDEKIKEKDEHLERPLESKPPEKVVIHDDHPDQTITIGGNLSVKCRFEFIEILWKHADAFAWTPADMTGIPRFIAEHELKTYPHIEPRVQRKRSIAPDRRRLVKDEVAEWLKARIVRKESEQIQKKQRPCRKASTLPRHPQKVYKQKGLSLDNRGRRSIPRNKETDNGATNLNGPKEGRRTHGIPINGQRNSQRRSISGKTWETSPNPLRLRITTKMKVEKMHAFVDSKLVASQVEGSYKAKSEKTRKYKEKALEMIPMQYEGLTKGVLIKELNERSVDMVEVNAIIKEATRTWMTLIQEYIKHGILPEDVGEA
nr:reverse transcriptase domain-containing protein [Tanacetum cinerariifolium]